MNRAAWITFIFVTGCVSVNLGPDEKNRRAQGVEYRQPGKPFERDERADVDAAWKNPSNGNVISFLSDCGDPSDPTLDTIVSGVVAGLADLNMESSETVKVHGREGRRVLAAGKVDGVPSKIDLLVFKRNHCIYILTHVGVSGFFNADRERFSRFIDGFKAP